MKIKTPLIRCTRCGGVTTLLMISTIEKNNETIELPLYICEDCGLYYTSSYSFLDNSTVRIDGLYCRNIINKKGNSVISVYSKVGEEDLIGEQSNTGQTIDKLKKESSTIDCYVYSSKHLNHCWDHGIKFVGELKTRKQKSGKVIKLFVKRCPVCDANYVGISTYLQHSEDFSVVRTDDAAKEIVARRMEDLAAKRDNPSGIRDLRSRGNVVKEDAFPKNITRSSTVNINEILLRDFVVRRSTFKCFHNKHRLKNVNAKISIIDKNGKILSTTVSAGYCADCKIFFILDSMYQTLKKKGIPICRVSDEKTYLKSNGYTTNGMKLAQESILMQYGYNVSQTEGLSELARHKILSLLIDNNIVTKADIISYLDFFIVQRKDQTRFGTAIDKWEADKDFVEEYRKGEFLSYGVSGIFRKY